MFLWTIYLFPRLVCLFCCRKICGPIVGIYRSLTDTWMWKLRRNVFRQCTKAFAFYADSVSREYKNCSAWRKSYFMLKIYLTALSNIQRKRSEYRKGNSRVKRDCKYQYVRNSSYTEPTQSYLTFSPTKVWQLQFLSSQRRIISIWISLQIHRKIRKMHFNYCKYRT